MLSYCLNERNKLRYQLIKTFMKAMIDRPEKKIEAPFHTFEVDTSRFPPFKVMERGITGESEFDHGLYNVDLACFICHVQSLLCLVVMRDSRS